MAAPSKKERLERAGVPTDAMTREELVAAYLRLPADGKLRKALSKYGVSVEDVTGMEAAARLKVLVASGVKPTLVERSYKVEIAPTYEQRRFLSRCIGIARYTYNWTLARARSIGSGWRFAPHNKHFTAALSAGEQPSWIRTLPATARRQAQKEVQLGYEHAFRRRREGAKGKRVGWPRFRSRMKHATYDSNQPGEAKVVNRGERTFVQIPKCPMLVRCKESGYLPNDLTVQSYAVSRIVDRWFISLSYLIPRPEQRGIHARGAVGIDPGIKTALVLSDGTRYEAPLPLIAAAAKLRRAQRHVARCYEERKRRNGTVCKGKALGPMGANERKARDEVARIHAEAARIRRDWQNKTTLSLVRKYSVIRVQPRFKGWVASGKGTIEAPGKMVKQKAKRNRKALDIGLGEICRELAYKCNWYGCAYEEVDQYFPSTQLCSACGVRTGPHGIEELGVREWTCSSCGTWHSRDHNAAKNIKDFPLWSKDDSGWHRADRPVKPSDLSEAKASALSGSDGCAGLDACVYQTACGRSDNRAAAPQKAAPVTATPTGGTATDTSTSHDSREQRGAAQITGGARTGEIAEENPIAITVAGQVKELKLGCSQGLAQTLESVGVL